MVTRDFVNISIGWIERRNVLKHILQTLNFETFLFVWKQCYTAHTYICYIVLLVSF